MPECDLCNFGEDDPRVEQLVEGTFFKRIDHGGLVVLCDSCWEKLDSVESGCSLCRGEIPEDAEKRHTVYQNRETAKGGSVCNTCRRIFDWNH